MAGFKEQIKAKFKAKYPTVTLSNARLDQIVDKLDAKTDSEDTIEAALDAINDITSFDEMAKTDDKIRQLEATAKTKGGKTAEQLEAERKAAEDADKAKGGDEAPAWFKAYTERTDAEIAAIKSEKTANTRKQALTDKVKDAPESYKNTVLKAFNRMQFESDEAFQEYLTETETDVTAAIQEQSNAGLGKDGPFRGIGGNTNKGEASQPELDAAFKNFKI